MAATVYVPCHAAELACNRYHGKTGGAAAAAANGHDSGDAELEAAVAPVVLLLGALSAQGVVSSTQMAAGMSRIRSAVEQEVSGWVGENFLIKPTSAGQRSNRHG